ncbi:MAG TPA: acyltransferase, partial [Candidatus Limnocylindrales bacterium]|nr:acyltransferase [Candidatus Limnocylindrales bacterium]
MALSRNANGFRPEIEGLRGVAILLVVVCHAGIAGFDAGFIGVDVFFVLSGFLITGLLADEHERTGRIELGSFYARRARRILPAAAVVLVATLVGALVVFSPLDMARIAQDGLAAGLSVANIRFAMGATDYFSAGDPSPMLHYWSLS